MTFPVMGSSMTFADTDTATDTAPGNDILATDGAIAEYLYGEDTPKNRGRVRALMLQIKPVEHRIPSCLMGGQRTSFKSWINRWIEECRAREEVRARAQAEAEVQAQRTADIQYQRRRVRSAGRLPASAQTPALNS